MEGLIPYVFRVIKRRRTRRYYRCLTLGQANYQSHSTKYLMPPPEKLEGTGSGHRRHRSMEDFSDRYYYSPGNYVDRPRLVKGGSLRMLASCITGA